MPINAYTREVIKQRYVPRLDNPQAVEAAGALARGVADVTATASGIFQRKEEAQKKIDYNNKVIEYQKEAYVLQEQMRHESLDNPSDFANRYDAAIKKLGEDYKTTFDDEQTRNIFGQSVNEYALSSYKNNFQWETKQTLDSAQTTIKQTADNVADLQYRKGLNNEPFDQDLLKNIDATVVGYSDLFSTQQLDIFRDAERERAVSEYYRGKVKTNPEAVLDILDNGFDPAADDITSVYDGANINDYIRGLALVESGDNPLKKNPNSSAKGKFQFINSTGKQYGLDPASFGSKEYEALEYQAAIEFTRHNASKLSKYLRRDPTYGELYLAHQQGAQGAIDLLKNPNVSAKEVVGLKAVENNLPKSMKGRAETITAGEFAALWSKKFNTKVANALDPQQAEKYRDEAKAYVKKDIMKKYSEYTSLYDAGFPPSNEISDALENKARRFDLEDVANDVALRKKTTSDINMFNQAPLAGQKQILVDTANNVKTEEGLYQYQSLANVYQKKIQAIQSGAGYDYYTKLGAIDPIEPINVQDPEGIAGAIEARNQARARIQQRDGVLIPLFSKQEASDIQGNFENLPIDQQTAYLSGLSSVLPQEDMRSLGKLIAPNNPNVAAALAVSSQNPKLANEAIKGALRKSEIQRKDIAAVVNDELSEAILDPVTIETMTDFIHNIAKERGYLANEGYDEGEVKQIIDDVTGGVINFGKSSVLPFQKQDGEFIDRGEFKQVLKNTTVDKLSNPPYMRGKPVTDKQLQEFFDEYRMITINDGRYAIQNAHNENEFLKTQTGEIFTIDVKSMVNQGAETRGFVGKKWDEFTAKAGEAMRPLPE